MPETGHPRELLVSPSTIQGVRVGVGSWARALWSAWGRGRPFSPWGWCGPQRSLSGSFGLLCWGSEEVSAGQGGAQASVWPRPVTGSVPAAGVIGGEDYEEVDRYNRQGRAGRASGRGAQQNRRGSWRYKRWEDLRAANILLMPPLRRWLQPAAALAPCTGFGGLWLTGVWCPWLGGGVCLVS